MRKLSRRTAAISSIVAFGFASASAPTFAADGQFFGLLRARDLTPFGFLRLDMRPSHAVEIEPGSWAFEMELGYQNTWALSESVEEYLGTQSGRRDLTPTDVAAIQALPGENYLIDVESAALDIAFHYKFSSVWSGYVIASGVSYQGGFLDGAIEGFHDTFGFSSFGRPAVTKNQVNLIYDLKSAQVAELSSPTDGGLTDPTVGLRYSGIPMPDRWNLDVEVAVKIPLNGSRELLSTGRTDYGLQFSLQRKGDRHALYLDAAGVYFAGARFPVPQDEQLIPTLILGYEYQITDKTNVNLQGYASRSVYSRNETELDELLKNKYQLSVGVRHRFERSVVSFAITENLQNLNNTPDIGFQLGFAYVPQRLR